MNFFQEINPYFDTVAPKSKLLHQRTDGLKLLRKGKKERNGGYGYLLCMYVMYVKYGYLLRYHMGKESSPHMSSINF